MRRVLSLRRFSIAVLISVFVTATIGVTALYHRGEETHATEHSEFVGTDAANVESLIPENAATPHPDSRLCGSDVIATYPEMATVEAIAWASHQIVVGTVLEQSDPFWSEPFSEGIDKSLVGGPSRTILSDFIVDVHENFRGEDLERLTVRTQGGTIGDCTITDLGAPTFEAGDEVLLFLYDATIEDQEQNAVFVPTGGPQGYLIIEDNGALKVHRGEEQVQEVNYPDLRREIIQVLQSEPARGTTGSRIIPTTESTILSEQSE